MNLRRLRLLVLAATVTLSGCATMAGTMIGTGVGSLAGRPFSGAMIGGGIGMLVDSQPSRSQGATNAQQK